jgi:hypothetical protein
MRKEKERKGGRKQRWKGGVQELEKYGMVRGGKSY